MLDLGYGVCRYALLLAEQGFDVETIDSSPAGLAAVLSTRDANYGFGRAIDRPDTFVIDRAERKGHPHCYCDAATLVGLLAGFDLLTLSQQLQERRPESHRWHIIVEHRR